MNIKVLSEDTINKIAAGEIIERPASVVKELIENSIDAGAGQIDIDIKAAGKRLIRVCDDGCGMDKEDAVECFERYATSKIEKAEDLASAGTLGFRGEALPSISGVSRVELITKMRSSDYGVRVRIEGGRMLEVKETGAPYGTTVSVKDLFYNTPARRKFFKTDNTEMAYIANIVSDYIIMYTSCGFSLRHNGRRIAEAFRKDTITDRIRALYGGDTADGLRKIDFKHGGIRVYGYAGVPSLNRPSRGYQFVFVNKRPVKSRLVNFAVSSAYEGLIPAGRFGVCFLFFDIEPGFVDVNVHPAKKEVRFKNHKEVQETVRLAVKQALGVKIPAVSGWAGERGEPERGTGFGAGTYAASAAGRDMQWMEEPGQKFMPQADSGNACRAFQVNDAYIIKEDKDGFEVWDQHAVHERIVYERIKKAVENKTAEGQRLLMPVTIELSAEEEEILKDGMQALTDMGFRIEPFGGGAVIVDIVPGFMGKADIKDLIKAVIAEIKEFGKAVSPVKLRDAIIKTAACRTAVRRGDRMDAYEIQRLVKDWYSLTLPYSCPHGRQAVIKMTKGELDRRFDRT